MTNRGKPRPTFPTGSFPQKPLTIRAKSIGFPPNIKVRHLGRLFAISRPRCRWNLNMNIVVQIWSWSRLLSWIRIILRIEKFHSDHICINISSPYTIHLSQNRRRSTWRPAFTEREFHNTLSISCNVALSIVRRPCWETYIESKAFTFT